MYVHHLTGPWFMHPGPASVDEGGIRCKVPSQWQLHAGLESHHGAVTYRTGVLPPGPEDGLRRTLVLHGVFYRARAMMGARAVGEDRGYFHAHMHDITAASLDEEGPLRVEVTCEREDNLLRKRQVLGVFAHWDLIPRDVNVGGLWRGVELWDHGPVLPLRARGFVKELSPARALLGVELVVWSDRPRVVTAELHMAPARDDGPEAHWRGRVDVGAGVSRHMVELLLPRPRIWWPHGHGEQPLYTVTTRVTPGHGPPEERVDRLGVRTVEMEDLQLRINGRNIFLRGANYAPHATFLSTVTDQQLRQDVRQMQALNLNFARVHAHVSPDAFYDAADEAGLLIWQDFPLQWQYDLRIQPEVLRQGRLLVDRLGHHPSVVVWCGHNEPISLGNTADLGPKDLGPVLFTTFGPSDNRDILDAALVSQLRAADTSRPSVRCSGKLHTPAARGTDTHLYFGWYPPFGPPERMRLLHRWLPDNFRLVTEFGAQSFPHPESLRTFHVDGEPVDWDRLRRERSAQPELLRRFNDLTGVTSVEELARRTQRYQANLLRTYVDLLRWLKGRPCGGFAAFCFNEPQLGVTWSVRDGMGRFKASAEQLRLSCSPRYAFALLEEPARAGRDVVLRICAVNDLPDSTQLHVHAEARQGGRVLASREAAVSLEADGPAHEVASLVVTPEAGTLELEVRWDGQAQTYRFEVAA
ncbi:MAG: glycoside hydrolase family 2 TIM barrel-domain containing protein [Myxococcota bacterium]